MQLSSHYDQIKALGTDLWAIAPQEQQTNMALVERRGLTFPVLSDPNLQVIHEWGLFDHDDPKGRLIPHPTTIMIDQDGTVRWSHVGTSSRDRPTIDQILEVLEALQKR